MRELERRGLELCIGAIHPPQTLLRHSQLRSLAAEVLYNPPGRALKTLVEELKNQGRWPMEAVERHNASYGEAIKAELRARNAVWFAREFSLRGVTHVHVHFANRATHTAFFIKKLSGICYSFTAHAQDFLIDFPNRALLGELIQESAFVVAVSDWSRQKLIQEFPEAAAKIHRVHNGIDTSLFKGPERRKTVGELRIVSVGRLIEFKGFHDLIEACSLLKEQGISFSCQIVGEGAWRERLEKQAQDRGLEGQITFLGARTQQDIQSLLGENDIFALACCVDAMGACDVLPTVITEAMAMGLPVVSTRLAGVEELVTDGVTGLLSAPGEPRALANNLARLAKDPSRRQEMGMEGRRRAESMFDVRSKVGELVALFPGEPATPSQSPRFSHLVLTMQPPSALGLDLERASSSLQWILPHELGVTEGGNLRVTFLPPSVVIESLWLDEGVRNDRFIELLQAWPASMDPIRFWSAARLYVACERGVRTWNELPLVTSGVEAGFVAWIRKMLIGATFAVVEEEGIPLFGETEFLREQADHLWIRTKNESEKWKSKATHHRKGQLLSLQAWQVAR